MKSLLVGNGINIQFGGNAYSNEFIMKRIKYRTKLGAYDQLFGNTLSKEEILVILNGFVGLTNEIIEGKFDLYIDNEDTRKAVIDFKNRYQKVYAVHDIMLEDWFFILHMYFLKFEDTAENIIASKQGFEQMILDAIYNGGKIQLVCQRTGQSKDSSCSWITSEMGADTERGVQKIYAPEQACGILL